MVFASVVDFVGYVGGIWGDVRGFVFFVGVVKVVGFGGIKVVVFFGDVFYCKRRER